MFAGRRFADRKPEGILLSTEMPFWVCAGKHFAGMSDAASPESDKRERERLSGPLQNDGADQGVNGRHIRYTTAPAGRPGLSVENSIFISRAKPSQTHRKPIASPLYILNWHSPYRLETR